MESAAADGALSSGDEDEHIDSDYDPEQDDAEAMDEDDDEEDEDDADDSDDSDVRCACDK